MQHRGGSLSRVKALQRVCGPVRGRNPYFGQRPCNRDPSRSSVVTAADRSGTGIPSKPLKFYYFDPHNPENVVEVVAKQQQQQQQEQKSLNNASSNGNGVSYALANGVGHVAGSTTAAVAVREVRGELSQVQVQGLTQQLEAARSTILKLQQYEMMYKESRMRNKQMSSELATLQHLLAEKDAELARQYKRMEMEASERSSLRTQFNAAIDEVKALRNELEEARQAMLDLKGALPMNLGQPKKAKAAISSGSGGKDMPAEQDALGAPEVLQSLQGLARQLADGMEHEVGSLFGAKREK